MEQNFLSPRWYGRLLGLLLNLAYRKGISFNEKDEVILRTLYIEVISKSTEEERELINQLLQKWVEQKKYEEQLHISISEKEYKILQDKGTKDVGALLRMGGPLGRLIQEVDFSVEEGTYLALQKRKLLRKRLIYRSVIVAFILAVVIYNLPYFKEMRCYNKVVDEPSIAHCLDYYNQYPDGKHYEDVMFMEIGLSSNVVKSLMNYLKKFPKGKYIQDVNKRLDNLWDIEIDKYGKRDKSKESPEAVKYMTEMLHYMKRNRINTIRLEVNPTDSLKDFDDYDERVKLLMKLLYKGETLPLEGNILSLKENFTEQDRDILMHILADGVQQSFNRMFSADFISVVTSDAAENAPVLSFNYQIKNRSDKNVGGLPDIWTYISNGKPTSYILAIDVRFNAKFLIPGSNVTYEYSEMGEPGEEIKGIQDVKDGYRQMTQVCFAKFSNKMSENLGLEEIYLKKEE